jgi:hypothetical protein
VRRREHHDPLINAGNSYTDALARLRREVKRTVDRGELPLDFIAELAGISEETALRLAGRPRRTDRGRGVYTAAGRVRVLLDVAADRRGRGSAREPLF